MYTHLFEHLSRAHILKLGKDPRCHFYVSPLDVKDSHSYKNSHFFGLDSHYEGTGILSLFAMKQWNMSENTRNMFHFTRSTKLLLFKTRSLIWEAHAAPVWSGWSANWTLFRSQLIACIHYQSQVGRGTWLIHYPPTAYSSMSGCQWLITQLN